MKKKAIILDIDGTVVDSPEQKVPTDRLVSALRAAESDYFICAATGRVWSFASPVMRAMGLEDYSIISGGTQIVNPKSGETVWQCNIDESDLQSAIDILKKYSNYRVLFNDYTEEDYLVKGGVDVNELQISEPVYFFEQIFVPDDIAPQIITELSQIEGLAIIPATAQKPGFKDLHITNRVATKEHSIAELLSRLGVDSADTIGVGDGHNDIHLFRSVGHRVAMGNAVSDLKEAADIVIGDVKDDGLAEYLESLV